MFRHRVNGTHMLGAGENPDPGSRFCIQMVWWLGLLALLLPNTYAQQALDMEARLKAVFIYNFLSYTTWPDDNPDEPYRIVVLGETPVTGYLREIAANRKVAGRPIVVEQATDWNDLRSCHVLYIPFAEADSITGILHSFGKEPVLTVSDQVRPGGDSTALAFYLDEGKLRFQVDLDRVRNSGIHLSSQLLKLAHVVGGEVSP